MTEPIAGAVDAMRMLKDGTMAVTLHFEPKDRAAVMAMMGEPGASIACVRLKNGHGAAPAPSTSYRNLGPICREAIDLCNETKFQGFVARPMLGKPQGNGSPESAKSFILSQCDVSTRKDLDTVPGARELFIEHVRKPFYAWMAKQ